MLWKYFPMQTTCLSRKSGYFHIPEIGLVKDPGGMRSYIKAVTACEVNQCLTCPEGWGEGQMTTYEFDSHTTYMQCKIWN